jgi:hypothetical protein
MVVNPRPQTLMVGKYTERAPAGQLLLDQGGRAARGEAQRVAREVDEFSSAGIAREVKLVRERCQWVLRVEVRSLRRVERPLAQVGACMAVPQTLQVRRASFA